MDSRLRGNDGERFARMTGTHDCVVIDFLCHSREGKNDVVFSEPVGVNQIQHKLRRLGKAKRAQHPGGFRYRL